MSSAPGLRPILFLVSAASSYRLQKYVAEHLANEGRSIVFMYEREDDETFRMIREDAAAIGAEAIAFEALVDPSAYSAAVWHRHPRLADGIAIWARVVATLSAGRVRSLIGVTDTATIRLAELRRSLASRLIAARQILERVAPSAIVACEDGIAALLPMHTAARAKDIPVVIVPYGNAVRRDLEIALDAKTEAGELIMATGRWSDVLQRHAPQWIKRGQHEGALMFPEEYIVAAESLGMTLRDAWTVHGGYAQRLCVESEQMRRLYIGEGLPASKLEVTGTPYCDVLLRALDDDAAAKSALRQPRRITSGVTRILVSWPPSYHAGRGQFSEFPTYREMTLAVLRWLAELPNTIVTVSVHPATAADDRQAVIDAGARLTDQYVIELIGKHDLFITYYSSTIRWAIAAGKPVINFDMYRVNLAAYDEAPGVRRVTTLTAFQDEVRRTIESDEAFAQAAAHQIAVAPDWGTLDGKNTSRVAAAILAMTTRQLLKSTLLAKFIYFNL